MAAWARPFVPRGTVALMLPATARVANFPKIPGPSAMVQPVLPGAVPPKRRPAVPRGSVARVLPAISAGPDPEAAHLGMGLGRG
eukprot:7387833-Lingulodinium_polyedra.AAC.1